MYELDNAPIRPLLTVIVPTRNRPGLLTAQLTSLRILLDDLIPNNYNVIVGDNSTGENASHVRTSVSSFPNHFSLRCSDRSLDTAEENLLRLMQYATGKFTWFLSDDDGLLASGVTHLVDQIQRDDCDIVVFNSLAVRDERIPATGPAKSPRTRKVFYNPETNCSISSFLLQTGFFYYIAGFSTTLVRTELLDSEVFQRYLAIGRIYAHVSFLAEIGSKKRFRFLNTPLVTFGMVGTDFDGGNAWHAAGIREGGFELSIWTLLWLRQLEELVKQGVFRLNELRYVCEMNHEQRFYWPHMLVQQTINQLIMPNGQIISEQHSSYIIDWLHRLLPQELFAIASIRRGFELTREGGKTLTDSLEDMIGSEKISINQIENRREIENIISSLHYWAEKITSRDWFQSFYVRTVFGHDQYYDGIKWFAFPVWNENRRAFLETFDLPSVDPYYIVATSEVELSNRCEGLGVRASRRLRPPILWLNKPETEAMAQQPSLQHFQDTILQAVDSATSRIVNASYANVDSLNRLGHREMPLAGYCEGDIVSMAGAVPQQVLAKGFSSAEPWGRWTDGKVVLIHVPLLPESEVTLVRLVTKFVYPSLVGKKLIVSVNGRRSALPVPQAGSFLDVLVGGSSKRDQSLRIKLSLPTAKMPLEGPVEDTRALGIGFSQIVFLGKSR